MATVQAVRGPLDASKLGVTLVHEHLCMSVWPMSAPRRFLSKAFNYQVTLAQNAVDVGINTIVDLSPQPSVGDVARLAEQVPDMNFVLSTGAYLEPHTPAHIRDLSEDGMVEHMLKNLTEGYDGFEKTGIRAGIIKVAGEKSKLTEWEKKNFRAAARVQQKLKVPIATHACAGAREQMEVLRDAGANIAATFYSHVEAEFGWDGRSLQQEAEYLADVARAGGGLHFNNFDFEFDTPLSDLLYLMNYLENRGFGDRVFFSIDANWSIDESGHIWHEAQKEHPETGKRTYAYAITNAVPMLMGGGVSLQRINKYLVDNPRRLFEAFGK